MKSYRVFNHDTQKFVSAFLHIDHGKISAFTQKYGFANGELQLTYFNNADIEFAPGLLDVNKKLIFQGDIIEYTSFDGKKYRMACPGLEYFHFWQETEDNETVQVIGNIHEDEELYKSLTHNPCD